MASIHDSADLRSISVVPSFFTLLSKCCGEMLAELGSDHTNCTLPEGAFWLYSTLISISCPASNWKGRVIVCCLLFLHSSMIRFPLTDKRIPWLDDTPRRNVPVKGTFSLPFQIAENDWLAGISLWGCSPSTKVWSIFVSEDTPAKAPISLSLNHNTLKAGCPLLQKASSGMGWGASSDGRVTTSQSSAGILGLKAGNGWSVWFW